MKKIFVIVLSLVCFSAYAETVDWATFQKEVKNKYEWVDYIGYSVYEEWNGDVEAYLKYLEENGQCGQ
jgi:hypothetical protein